MYIVYDYAFSVWLVMFGDQPIDVCGRRYFTSKKDLRNHLKAHKLALRGAQIVTAD